MRIISTWRRDKVSRKKLKRLRKEKKRRFIEDKALELQANTPKSELWFYEKFSKEPIKRIVGLYKHCDFNDQKNVTFHNNCIPDILNTGYRYIVEIDGDSHNSLKQAYRDLSKDRIYRSRDFKVFRIKAYDEVSYATFVVEFKQYIEQCHNTFLRGLMSVLEGVELPGLSKNQRGYIKTFGKSVQLKDIITIEAVIPNMVNNKLVKKPKTILRKASA